MIHHSTKQRIAVMQAFVDGLEIEYTVRVSPRRWQAIERDREPCWNWRSYDYRVKPRAPVVAHVIVDSNTNAVVCAFADLATAESWVAHHADAYFVVTLKENPNA